MDFWSIYWPVFAALVSATLIFETLTFILTIIANQRQMKKLQEQARILMEQGIVPGFSNGTNMPFAMFNGTPNYGGGQFPPTTSGTTIEHGHYL